MGWNLAAYHCHQLLLFRLKIVKKVRNRRGKLDHTII